MPKFDQKEFQERLTTSAALLDDAIDMLKAYIADPDPDFTFSEPGAPYLLGRLDVAVELIEQQLPEFQQAAAAQLIESLIAGAEQA